MKNIILLCFLVGLFVRVDTLGKESLWNDEMSTYYRSNVGGAAAILDDISKNDVHPPLYFIAEHYVQSLFGDSPEALRLLSVISSTLTILVVALMATALFSRAAGILAAVFWSLGYVIVVYAQEARSYSFMLLFLSIAMLNGFRVIRGNARRRHFVYLTVSCTIASLSHYFGLAFAGMVLCSIGIIQLLRRQSIGPLLISSSIVSFFCCAWVVYFRSQNNIYTSGLSKMPTFPPPTLSDLWFGWVFLNDGYQPLAIFVLALLIIGLCVSIRSYGKTREEIQEWILLFTWTFCPLLGTFFFSIWVTPMFNSRYLLVCLLPLILLKAQVLTSIPNRVLRGLSIATIGFAMIFISFFGKYNFYSEIPRNEQFREATFEASQLWHVGTKIYSFTYASNYIDYYLRRTDISERVTANLPELSSEEVAAISDDKIIVVRAGRDWRPEDSIKNLLNRYKVEAQKQFRVAEVLILTKKY